MAQTKVGSGFVATGAVGPTSLSTGAPYWDTSGNVGIGTTSPETIANYVFVQAGTAGNLQGIFQATDGTSKVAMYATSGLGIVSTRTAHPLALYTNGSERMRIDSSGNVGIGTSSPGSILDVQSATSIIRNTATTGTNQVSIRQGNTGGFFYTGIDTSTGGFLTGANYAAFHWMSGAYPMIFATNNSERMRITSSGGVSFGSSGTAYGTSGQVLTSAGNAPPTWSTISSTGSLIRAPRVLTSGTSYTTPAGCNNIFIEMIGGGGGGSGNNRTDTSNATGGGGGGASPYGSVYVAVTPSTSYTYAIGAGGAGLSGTGTATTGGTTSITIGATTYSCSGGVGGNTTGNNNSGTGGAAGTATNMNVTITPIASTCPAGGSISCPLGFGIGGMRFFLTLGLNGGTTTGQAGIGWGAGGGGSWNQTATGTTTGGAGSQGIIRIWEYT